MKYQEKQEQKLEKYQELSKKAQQESEAQYKRSKRISDLIPMGQPVLVGHHSEKRHRKDIERIQNSFNKSVELQNKAEYYKSKAERILNPTAISSDNPEAINLLKEKLNKLEAKRQKCKDYNKKARKENKEALPSYVLSNLSQNIRSVKERIKHLENIRAIPETEKIINGVVLKIDKEENRVKLIFSSVPSKEARKELKRNGFKWSPLNKCWMRQLSNRAVYIAEELCGGGN